MKENLTYKGFICLDESDYRLIVKDNKTFRTIPITYSDNFNDINHYSASIASVKFFDGTEQISMNQGVEIDFLDIFISVSRHATIKIETEKNIFNIVKNDYANLQEIWQLVDEYYETLEGKERFEEYSIKNVWE